MTGKRAKGVGVKQGRKKESWKRDRNIREGGMEERRKSEERERKHKRDEEEKREKEVLKMRKRTR